MSSVLETEDLTKRYRGKTALSDCTITVPRGHVVGLVGPNGSGKSTLLNIASGVLSPTSGSVRVFDAPPASSPTQRERVGFVAQDTPVYSNFSVRDHLRYAQHVNPKWDDELALRRIKQLGLNLSQRAGKLSGGQRAQLALTLAIAKRPDLLLLDEPVASLDPLARREFLQILMETVAEDDVSVLLSSHLVADIERVCDYLVVLVASRVQVAGDVEDLLASHHRLIGPRDATVPDGQVVIESSYTERQSTLFVRSDGPITDSRWTVEAVNLEDVVLAYMGQGRTGSGPAHNEESA
ncbi:MAG: ABC transporter ATP-binding protein [Acidimicrobiales bacterium]